jgi:hypothetical protein
MVPRLVTGVAEDDHLNVRVSPRASARVVGKAYNNAWIFVVPTRNTWWRVSVQHPASGESGRFGSVAGYASRRFVTQSPSATV